MRGWLPTWVLTLLAGLAVFAAFSVPGIRHVAHRVPVAGAPGRYVELVEYRSVLFHGGSYWVYFDEHSYDMHPFRGSREQLREFAAEYDGRALMVIFPSGAQLTVAGWRP